MARNTIKCSITGKERVTNNVYLQKKATQANCTVDDFRANYVTKPVLIEIRAKIKAEGMESVCKHYNTDQAKIEAIIRVNSKTKKPKA